MGSKHVLICLWGQYREIEEGILRYAQQTDWQVELYHGRLPAGWYGDGIITDYGYGEIVARIPVADTVPIIARELVLRPGVANVTTIAANGTAVGELAAEYFLHRGYEHYAVVCSCRWPMPEGWGRVEDVYVRAVARHGGEAHCFYWAESVAAAEAMDYREAVCRVREFLRNLPRPCALFSPNVYDMRIIFRAAVESGLRIPEELALLNNGDDPVINRMSSPAISAIAGELNDIGLLMASALDDRMAGRPVAASPLLPCPTHIITRRSTDTLAHEHPVLQKAMAFIRNNYRSNISVGDIADHVGISLSQLKSLMHAQLGNSPGKILREMRLTLAHKLLLSGDQTLDEIASRCGYSSKVTLSQTFRRLYGHPPGYYRSRPREEDGER